MNQVLEQIKVFADKAHANQMRKYSPDRYIVHPVRVMQICERYTSCMPVLAAALLHDVLEDTSVTENKMRIFLSSVMNKEDAAQTTALVVELTDVYTKARHPGWNRRKRKVKEAERIRQTSGDSQTVKYADIIDNCSEIVVADPDFAGVFLFECKMLLRKMLKGNPELYKEAVDTVQRCITQLQKEHKANAESL